MTDRSPIHSDEPGLEASTSYSDDGFSSREGKERYSHDDTYSDDYASQVSGLLKPGPGLCRISCRTYQVEVASHSRTV